MAEFNRDAVKAILEQSFMNKGVTTIDDAALDALLVLIRVFVKEGFVRAAVNVQEEHEARPTIVTMEAIRAIYDDLVPDF